MLLTIWTKTVTGKTLTTLSPVLRTVPDLPVAVVNDHSVPEGTTVILALGGEPLKKLQGDGIFAKNRTTTSYRTIPHMVGLVPVLVSYSPDIAEIDYGYYIDLLTDVSLVVRFCLTGKWLPTYGHYRYVPDFEELCTAIEAKHFAGGEPVDVAKDLETLGLDPYALPMTLPPFPGAYIVSMQASHKKGTADVVRFTSRGQEADRLADPAFREQIEFLLRSPMIRLKGANFKYDLHWLWKRAAISCTNFTFDTTIVGSLLDENRSNSLDTHVKIYAPELGGYCISPETRLLTADMQWVKAGEIQEGDELVGFEEEPQFKRRRQLDVSKVTAIKSLEKRCYRLTMKSGRSLTVSDNHQFLHVRDVYGGKIEWIQTEEIVVGMRLKTFPMRQFDESFDSGWMSGILDGEGWGSRSKTPTGTNYKIGWAQKKGKVLTRSITLAAHWGLKFSAGSPEVKTPSVTLYGWDGFELLQLTRPVRLVAQRKWVKTPVPTRNRDEEDVVVSKELVGKQEVLAITTTTHTFIAEGMCSHNSDQFDRTVDKSRMDLVPPDKLLPYAGGDVDGGLQVADAMKRELLRDQRLTSFYVNILHPASRAFEQVEQGGICIDKAAYQELKSDLETEHARLVKEAVKIMGGRIWVKHGDVSKPGGMNLTKASMLCDFMFSPMGLNLKPKMYTAKPDKDGIKRPSTAMEHLEMFVDEPKAKDFINIIRQDSSVMKTYNTYVVGFLEHLRSDGRYHPTYYLFVGNQDEGEGGARTGRLSCKAPAFQCMVGETEVLTQEGYLRLDELVESGGWGHKVKTHTGEWQEVVGVYRNGRQPVYRITTVLGKQVTCTGNHPILTPTGWVRTDALTNESVILTHRLTEADGAAIRKSGGQDVWSLDGLKETGDEFARDVDLHLRLQSIANGQSGELEVGQHYNMRVRVGREEGHARRDTGQENKNVSVMGRYEDPVSQPEIDRMGVLRWEGNSRLHAMDVLPALLGRHGGDAQRLLAGTERCEWGLHPGQLHLDSATRAESEQEEFQEEQVLCIERLGWRDTFDLTIENSHSFIANGVVVHNTVPKHTFWATRIRRCYPAPPGYVVVERDYGQGELRVVACIANEENMINVFKSGRDIHADTAAPFAGYTYDSLMALEKTDLHTFEETRQLGKAGNFGLVFGMREDGFINYARSNYGVELTREEAHKFRTTYFQKYPRLETYHTSSIEFAKQYKHVRTPLGRVRHLPLIKSPNREVAAKAERQAINSPVQGTLTDMCLWTIALEHKSGLSAIAPCFGACHDSILNYVPEDRVDEIVPKLLDTMEQLPFHVVGWTPQLKFVADAKFGVNWGDLRKFKRPL